MIMRDQQHLLQSFRNLLRELAMFINSYCMLIPDKSLCFPTIQFPVCLSHSLSFHLFFGVCLLSYLPFYPVYFFIFLPVCVYLSHPQNALLLLLLQYSASSSSILHTWLPLFSLILFLFASAFLLSSRLYFLFPVIFSFIFSSLELRFLWRVFPLCFYQIIISLVLFSCLPVPLLNIIF